MTQDILRGIILSVCLTRNFNISSTNGKTIEPHPSGKLAFETIMFLLTLKVGEANTLLTGEARVRK